MLLGVVSDTHNNIKNIKKIIKIFNDENVEFVIHTGDICTAKTLEFFSELTAPFYGVYGNNDRFEKGLKEICRSYNFFFQDPPFPISLNDRKIVIFHEPEPIDEFIQCNKDIDLILHGHTHRYREENLEDLVIFNPGESAGLMAGKNALGIVDLDELSIKRIFF